MVNEDYPEEKPDDNNGNNATFNSALDYLNRICLELRQLNENWKANDYLSCESNLEIIHDEIYPKLKKEEDDKLRLLFNTLPRNNKAEYARQLHEINRELRRLLHQYRFLMPLAKDPSQALLDE